MIDLLGGATAAVRYDDGSQLDTVLSPRPFLTATARGGAVVTDVSPADHAHHLGVSVAIPDVDGTSFWGGRTYDRQRGSVLLANHGTQRVCAREVTEGRVSETLSWVDQRGEELLTEARTISVRESDDGWELTWLTDLVASGQDITFGSPQTNGRVGAFYGGIFWRTPFANATVRSADGAGIEAAHGSSSPWIALDGVGASLVAATTTGMPWFVRTSGYTGFGPAVAVSGRRHLAAGETLHLDLAVAVLDRAPEAPDRIAARLFTDTQELAGA